MIKTPKKCFKGVIALMCCVTMLLGLCKAPVVSMAAEVDYYTPSNGQVLMFENAESGWALNTMHGSSSAPNGTAMDLYRYDGTDTERFRVSSNSDGSFMLSPLCTPSKYIDVRRYGAPLAVGQGICIWAADGDPLKNFKIKVVGDKVAIVLATRPDLCIAPSSAANAYTQNQLIVRQLDTSKTEMLWTLRDGSWNTISAAAGNIENYIDPNPNYKFVTLSTMCMSNKVLQVENGKIKYGTAASTVSEAYNRGQIFCLVQGNRFDFYLCPVTGEGDILSSFVTASSLSDHAELITTGFNASNVDCQRIASISNETHSYCPTTIGGVANGDICSFVYKNWYTIDVRDYGNSPERVVQVYPYGNNSAQQFRVNVVDEFEVRRNSHVNWALNHWDDVKLNASGNPEYFSQGVKASPYGRCASFVLHSFLYGYDIPRNKLMIGSYGLVGNVRTRLREAGFTFTELNCYNVNGKLACSGAAPGDVVMWEDQHVALVVEVRNDGTLVCVQSNPMLGPNRVSPDGKWSDGTYTYGKGFNTIGKVLHITGFSKSW